MRKTDLWFEVTYKENGVFKTQHYRGKDKARAERWGNNKFGKIYGVEKVNIDDLYKSKESEYNNLIARQQPLGLKITKNLYESDIDLTEMLLGKPKKDTHIVKTKKLSKWDLIAESE